MSHENSAHKAPTSVEHCQLEFREQAQSLGPYPFPEHRKRERIFCLD